MEDHCPKSRGVTSEHKHSREAVITWSSPPVTSWVLITVSWMGGMTIPITSKGRSHRRVTQQIDKVLISFIHVSISFWLVWDSPSNSGHLWMEFQRSDQDLVMGPTCLGREPCWEGHWQKVTGKCSFQTALLLIILHSRTQNSDRDLSWILYSYLRGRVRVKSAVQCEV